MAKKITYLLGAGASANALPVVADMFFRMREVVFRLENERMNIEDAEALDLAIKEINWLLKEAGAGYYTIDTLAKKFYLIHEIDKLERLKHCLILYFTLEQYIFIPSQPEGRYRFENAGMDIRYGSFIASIAKPLRINPKVNNGDNFSIELSNSISILSWNYDIQFELSLQRTFEQDKKLHFTQTAFQIFPNEVSLYETDSYNYDSEKFSMIKLNGNAIWNEIDSQGPRSFTQTVFDVHTKTSDKITLLNYFLSHYREFHTFKKTPRQGSDPTMMFNFAWENEIEFKYKYDGHAMNLKKAEQIANDTEILVVIGYSFPIFNREIDNVLFEAMKKKLRKIYIQDMYPQRIQSTMANAFQVCQQTHPEMVSSGVFKNVPIVDFHLEDNLNQFVIPYELYK